MELKNKVVLITGGSKGIGQALCKEFLIKGAEVYSIDLDKPEDYSNIKHIKADITKIKDLEKLKELPKADIIINNAGIMKRGKILDCSEEDFQNIIKVNVKGIWHIMKYANYKPNATILNISSRHAIEKTKDPGLYAFSKMASIQLMKVISNTHPRLKCKNLFLGPVETELSTIGLSKVKMILKKRLMKTPYQIAVIIIYFLEQNKNEIRYNTKKNDYDIS